MDVKKYLDLHCIATFENGERCFNNLKSAMLGSIYYDCIEWHNRSVFFKGQTPHEYRAHCLKTGEDFMELPLFSPLEHGDLKKVS